MLISQFVQKVSRLTVGGVEIVDGDLAGGHEAEQGQSHHGDHGGDGQWQGLRHPVDGHQHDKVGALHGLHYLGVVSA